MSLFASFFRTAAGATALALSLVPSAAHAEAGAKTLRFIPQADLRSIDPIWTTAYVSRNFGYLVFDTLFSLDKDFKPQPQMVDRWTVSDDKLTYSFTLRPGLKWHDGQPVRCRLRRVARTLGQTRHAGSEADGGGRSDEGG